MDGFDLINPTHYKLFLEPDLENYIFDGITEFEFELVSETNQIQLHALDLTINSVHRIKENKEIELKFTIDLEKQLLLIDLDNNLKGQQKLVIKYKGEHNDNLAGFYRGKHKTREGITKTVVVTQFQPNDARRAFPCVDIPGKKAKFDIQFLVDKAHFTISNMPIIKEMEKDNNKKIVTFDTTPTMSTYLLFFGVGDFEFIQKESKGKLYRTIAHPPKAENNGKFSLDFGIKVVEYCEEFFDFDYPLPKLDQIATPAFAAGAMENWGAILYRENALLYYDGITSNSQKNAILGVIAHEIAHQWFGNLVSPKTWKWLWLNESFATFFAIKVVDHYFPERRMFDYYVANTNLRRRSRSTSGVMDWDSMINTSPIEIKGDGAINFTAKTVPILYSKGGSILRQVEAYLGEDGFKNGLKLYFKKYAYKASQSDYLWSSLSEATGKPVNKMMETWVLQEGLPLVTISRENSVFNMSQERFTYLPNESDNIWIVPVSIKLFKKGTLVEELMLELDTKSKTFDLSEIEFDAYKVNTDMTGFFRTKYPDQDYEMLAELIKTKVITPIDRLVLEDELFALLKAGKIKLDKYLNFIKHYENETSHLSLQSIAIHLTDIYKLAENDLKDEITQVTSLWLNKVFDNIGYYPKDDEDMGISIIRGNLVNLAVELEINEAIEFATKQFKKLKNKENISSDLRQIIKSIAAKLTNENEWFEQEFENPESESEFISTILAMANYSDKTLLENFQERLFTDVPNRNRGFTISEFCKNPQTAPEMFEFYLANLDQFESLNNFMYQSAILSVISTGINRYEEIESFFLDYKKQSPNSSDAIEVGLEQLNIKKKFKEILNN